MDQDRGDAPEPNDVRIPAATVRLLVCKAILVVLVSIPIGYAFYLDQGSDPDPIPLVGAMIVTLIGLLACAAIYESASFALAWIVRRFGFGSGR